MAILVAPKLAAALPSVRDPWPVRLGEAGSLGIPPAVGRPLQKPAAGSDWLGAAAEALKCNSIKKRHFRTNQSANQHARAG